MLISKTKVESQAERQAAIRAVAHAATCEPRFLSELVFLAQSGEQFVLAVVANFLFLNREQLKNSEHLETLVRSLVGLKPEFKGTIENFDWILHELYADPAHRELVFECLSAWTTQHGSRKLRDAESIELFHQTILQIADDGDALPRLITYWLSADELQLAAACGGLISFFWVRGVKKPIFSKEILDTLSAPDLMYLARRMLGYVVSEEPLISMVFSMLNTHDAKSRTFELVYTLLVREVGRDFTHATLEAIKERTETANADEARLLNAAHANISAYIEAIEGLPRLQELRPPLQLRRLIALNRAREMRKSMDDANEKSVFRQLATETPLKAGVGWFSVSNGGVGETHRLQSFSANASLPRRALADPVGYAISGLGYRLAKRGEE
jgi:hypothetical protein